MTRERGWPWGGEVSATASTDTSLAVEHPHGSPVPGRLPYDGWHTSAQQMAAASRRQQCARAND